MNKMKIGTDSIPSMRSANAMLMTRNKLFLRSLLLTTNRKMMSKFPTIIKSDAKVKALHNAMPSTLEKAIAPLAFPEDLLSVDVLFIFGFSMRVKTFSLRCYALMRTSAYWDVKRNSSTAKRDDEELANHSKSCISTAYNSSRYTVYSYTCYTTCVLVLSCQGNKAHVLSHFNNNIPESHWFSARAIFAKYHRAP